MPATLKKWEVLPHAPLTRVNDDILTAEGDIQMPAAALHRRMTVVRLKDRRLIVFSAIALDEDEMRQLEDFGTPAFLIVPNAHHRMDAKIWKARYPALRVVAPEGAREKVAEVVAVDQTTAEFGDPRVTFLNVPGTKGQESALEVTGSDGITLVLNDIVANIRDAHGFGGWLLKLMGFAGDAPHVPTPVKMSIVADKAALAAQLRRWAGMPVTRIIVSHGAIIDRDARAELERLAAALT